MDDNMKLYWKVFSEEITTEEVIRESSNPLREYESEFIDGAIIDIGCGQSNFLLEYANSGRTLYAIDNEDIQLNYLKERANEISNDLSKWNFINLSFPDEELPEDQYSFIILSNFLHFFSLEDCKNIESILRSKLDKGGLIYILVHSHKYYQNNPENPKNNDYFKHYFTIEDIQNIFNNEAYEYVYVADIEKVDSEQERKVTNKTLDLLFKRNNITDMTDINSRKKDFFKDKKQADIQVILRKK